MGDLAERSGASAAMRRAKETLIETGELPPAVSIRPDIAASWRRSALCHVRPDSVIPQTDPEIVRPAGQVWEAAEPVLERRKTQLVDIPSGIVLADQFSRVVDCVATGQVARLYAQSGVEVGIILDESLVGTNGIGTVIEIGRAIRIEGSEHFIDAFQWVTCIGVPIRHPVTRQIQGVLNVSCRSQDANQLLWPFVVDAVREIEQRLYFAGSRIERLLLEQFISASKRRNHPVISLSDRIIISNPAGSRLVGDIDQAILWEYAAQAVESGAGREGLFTMKTGHVLRTRCHPITDGASVIGALLEIEPLSEAKPMRRSTRKRGDQSLPQLAGNSAAWRGVCEQAGACREHDLPLLFVGEPGVGKMTIVRALFAEEAAQQRLVVFDAAMQPIEGVARWVKELRSALPGEDQVVVIRHLEALEAGAAQAVCTLCDTYVGVGARLVATLARAPGAAAPYGPLVNRLAVATIEVPPLRHRFEDLPDLLRVLTKKHAAGGYEPRWMPESPRRSAGSTGRITCAGWRTLSGAC